MLSQLLLQSKDEPQKQVNMSLLFNDSIERDHQETGACVKSPLSLNISAINASKPPLFNRNYKQAVSIQDLNH